MSAAALLAAGVFVPAPRWVHLTTFGFGLLAVFITIGITANTAADTVQAPSQLSPRAIKRLQLVFIPLGVIAAGYLTAAVSGHGAGPIYSTAQLDSGTRQFGSGNLAFLIAMPVYWFGTTLLLVLPWVRPDRRVHGRPFAACWLAYNLLGVTGFVVGHAAF